MKYNLTTLFSLLTFVGLTPSAMAETPFIASLNDSHWDGKRIPAGQQCLKFGGQQPATPALNITGIPQQTNLLILEYSDRSYEPMNHGGHGRMAYAISSPAPNIQLPAVAGHSVELPTGFMMLEAHRNPKWDKAGAYMPPCSGGRGNVYYVTVKAVHYDGVKTVVLAKTVLEMGEF
ncbi:hypothetical protein [Thiomicrorhabdus arctica]|uniref:hypothetical protein n=1 Tax=Thiomicrorhabdus arctica TaxID=131540 RepID=UPI00037A4791|nr:hypothetical protein [Thiomicrorhabdus arctica]